MILSIQNLTFREPVRLFGILGWSLSALCQESWWGTGLFLRARYLTHWFHEPHRACRAVVSRTRETAEPIRAIAPDYRRFRRLEQRLRLAPSRLCFFWHSELRLSLLTDFCKKKAGEHCQRFWPESGDLQTGEIIEIDCLKLGSELEPGGAYR